MSLKDDIQRKAREIRDTSFIKKSTNSVPSIDTPALTFGCTGLTFPATVLYIDMRGSTKLLNTHQRRVTAKIHMIYYHTICKIAKQDGGEIRSFNGDSLLVFFYGNSVDVTRQAVRSAFRMRYAITDIINQTLTEYTDIDFGIGIDYGEILATKVGFGGNSDNKDLIWIGNAVNRSTKISDECCEPNYVGISERVYNRLDESLIHYKERNSYGYELVNEVWNQYRLKYNDNYEDYYKSSCQIKIS